MAMQDSKQILIKSEVILDEGETLEIALEAELWADSSNPIARFLGRCLRLFYLLVGFKQCGYIIITNKRILEISQTKACWFFNTGKEVKSIMPSSVKEVGYRAQGTFCGCFCQAYHFYYDAYTQKTSVLLKGANEEEAAHVAKTFYELLSKDQDSSV